MDELAKERTIKRIDKMLRDDNRMPWWGVLLIVIGIVGALAIALVAGIKSDQYSVETKITEEMYNYGEVLDRYDSDFTIVKIQQQNTYYTPHDELPPTYHFSIHIVTVLGFTGDVAIKEDWAVATYYRLVWHGLWNEAVIIDCDIIRLEVS